MNWITSDVTYALSVLVILGQIFVLFVIIACILSRETFHKIAEWISPRTWLLFALIIALLSTLGSLYYSEIAGFIPCKLCWFQRIFLYPQVVILAFALWRKDFSVKLYTIALSVIGFIFSLVHVYEQLSQSDVFACAAGGQSCAKIYFTEFGYITFSVMALSAFALIVTFVALATSRRGMRISSQKI